MQVKKREKVSIRGVKYQTFEEVGWFALKISNVLSKFMKERNETLMNRANAALRDT